MQLQRESLVVGNESTSVWTHVVLNYHPDYGYFLETGWHYHGDPPRISGWRMGDGVGGVFESVGPPDRVTVLNGMGTRQLIARIGGNTDFDLDLYVRVGDYVCPVFGGRPTNDAGCQDVGVRPIAPPRPPPKVVIE